MSSEPIIRLAITYDWTPQQGFFLKSDCRKRFADLRVELVPIYDDLQKIKEVLAGVDGLIIPGGVDDVDPTRYGQEKKHDRVRINTKRTDFEFHVLEEAFRRELPIFTICWGLQILNVFLGGSLHQHLPMDKPGTVVHEQDEAPHKPTHWVMLENNSFLMEKIGTPKLFVNSTHHQAIESLGKGLIVEALSDDGVIEAVKFTGGNMTCFGVQWHPERLIGDPVIPLFLNECLKRKT